MAICSEFSHQNMWFSIAMLNYQKVIHEMISINFSVHLDPVPVWIIDELDIASAPAEALVTPLATSKVDSVNLITTLFSRTLEMVREMIPFILWPNYSGE